MAWAAGTTKRFRGARSDFAFVTGHQSVLERYYFTAEGSAVFSLRSSRQRAYWSLLVGLGSSSPFNQKVNQSTNPCCFNRHSEALP